MTRCFFWYGPREEGRARAAQTIIGRDQTLKLFFFSFFLSPSPRFLAENSWQDSWWQTALLQSIQGCTCIWERLEIQHLLVLHPFILSYSFSSFFLSLSVPASWHIVVVAGRQHWLWAIKGTGKREGLKLPFPAAVFLLEFSNSI